MPRCTGENKETGDLLARRHSLLGWVIFGARAREMTRDFKVFV